MVRKWSNQNLAGAWHFVTGNVVDRIPIFKRDDCCESFLKVCSELLRDWPCKIIAFVLMPDHVHLIVNPEDGRIREFVGKLKGQSAMRIVKVTGDARFRKEQNDSSEHQVWQQSFKAQALWSSWMIWQKINYIHANPVRAGLVGSAKDYRWSSFRAFYSDSGEPLAVDREWWWPNDSQKLSEAVKELGWRTWEKRN